MQQRGSWSHILRCEGRIFRRNEILGKEFMNSDVEMFIRKIIRSYNKEIKGKDVPVLN
jgi:hypothetical protein